MKKFLALILSLCLMAAVIPALAEPAGEAAPGAEATAAEAPADESGVEGKLAKLIALASTLKEKFEGSKEQLSAVLRVLKRKAEKLIEDSGKNLSSVLSGLKDKLAGEGGLGSALSGLKDKLAGGGDLDLSALGDLFGSGETPEDDESIDETIARINEEAEKEFGDGVPNKKKAESAEEFYGEWLYVKYIYDGEEIEVDDPDEGFFIGEGVYYATLNGEKSEYNLYDEKVEMKFDEEHGVLKILHGDMWSTYVLTEDGSLVHPGGSLQTICVRVGE